MGKFILGVIIGVALVMGAVLVFFVSGMAPVETSAPAMPMEKWTANHALQARVDKLAPKTAALKPTDENLIAGASIYRMNCALCHGLPGKPETPIAHGMYPHPPQLFHGKGVTDDPPGETYWKVKNGIRLTGMPSFSTGLSETEMWQVAQMLANADKLPGEAQAELGGQAPAQPKSQGNDKD